MFTLLQTTTDCKAGRSGCTAIGAAPPGGRNQLGLWFNREVKSPIEGSPRGAVAGLSDILLALGDELRRANHQLGEYSVSTESGEEIKEPILFLAGATGASSQSTSLRRALVA